MVKSIDMLLAQARTRFVRVAPEVLASERANGAIVIDIRPVDQRLRDGEIPGAIVIDRNSLEWRLDPSYKLRIAEITDHDIRIIIVCNEGFSSSLATASLHDLGLHRATDLIGGFQAWRVIHRGGNESQ